MFIDPIEQLKSILIFIRNTWEHVVRITPFGPTLPQVSHIAPDYGIHFLSLFIAMWSKNTLKYSKEKVVKFTVVVSQYN